MTDREEYHNCTEKRFRPETDKLISVKPIAKKNCILNYLATTSICLTAPMMARIPSRNWLGKKDQTSQVNKYEQKV